MLRRILEIPQFGMWIAYTKAAHRRRRMFRVMWNFTKVSVLVLVLILVNSNLNPDPNAYQPQP